MNITWINLTELETFFTTSYTTTIHSFLKFNFPKALLMNYERSCGFPRGSLWGNIFGTNHIFHCRHMLIISRHWRDGIMSFRTS